MATNLPLQIVVSLGGVKYCKQDVPNARTTETAAFFLLLVSNRLGATDEQLLPYNIINFLMYRIKHYIFLTSISTMGCFALLYFTHATYIHIYAPHFRG